MQTFYFIRLSIVKQQMFFHHISKVTVTLSVMPYYVLLFFWTVCISCKKHVQLRLQLTRVLLCWSAICIYSIFLVYATATLITCNTGSIIEPSSLFIWQGSIGIVDLLKFLYTARVTIWVIFQCQLTICTCNGLHTGIALHTQYVVQVFFDCHITFMQTHKKICTEQ